MFVIKCLSFGIDLGLRGSKFGILGEKWCKTRKNRGNFAWSKFSLEETRLKLKTCLKRVAQ